MHCLSPRGVFYKPIGHFRVLPGLCIKTRLSAENYFFSSYTNNAHIHKKGCALGLTLKVGGFLELGSGLLVDFTIC